MIMSSLLFSGSSHPSLADEISLQSNIKLGKIKIEKFPDGESYIEVQENIQGKDVFVLQTLAFHPNDYLIELLLIIDALRRASARQIIAIIPYLNYCRQDRKTKDGTPISAKLVANLLSNSGIHKLITFDLHSDQIEGFFEIPVEHIHAQPLLAKILEDWEANNRIIVAPDTGSIKIAEKTADLLNANLAVIQKKRINSTEIKMSLIGDVLDRNVIISDDLCSTGTTLLGAVELCRRSGAKRIIASITHTICTKIRHQKLIESDLDYLLTTNTCPQVIYPKLHTFSIAYLVTDAIKAYSL